MPTTDDLLLELAGKYIWWCAPEEAVRSPRRVIAQVMNIGDYDDVQRMASRFGDDTLRDVLASAGPGHLDARSWVYWHYRLGLAVRDAIPPLPTRRLG